MFGYLATLSWLSQFSSIPYVGAFGEVDLLGLLERFEWPNVLALLHYPAGARFPHMSYRFFALITVVISFMVASMLAPGPITVSLAASVSQITLCLSPTYLPTHALSFRHLFEDSRLTFVVLRLIIRFHTFVHSLIHLSGVRAFMELFGFMPEVSLGPWLGQFSSGVVHPLFRLKREWAAMLLAVKTWRRPLRAVKSPGLGVSFWAYLSFFSLP